MLFRDRWDPRQIGPRHQHLSLAWPCCSGVDRARGFPLAGELPCRATQVEPVNTYCTDVGTTRRRGASGNSRRFGKIRRDHTIASSLSISKNREKQKYCFSEPSLGSCAIRSRLSTNKQPSQRLYLNRAATQLFKVCTPYGPSQALWIRGKGPPRTVLVRQ